jgi:hypothetical protein
MSSRACQHLTSAPEGVDKTTALLIEKAMVAQYFNQYETLPEKQGLPNFGYRNKSLNEVRDVVDFFLKEFKNVFK